MLPETERVAEKNIPKKKAVPKRLLQKGRHNKTTFKKGPYEDRKKALKEVVAKNIVIEAAIEIAATEKAKNIILETF